MPFDSPPARQVLPASYYKSRAGLYFRLSLVAALIVTIAWSLARQKDEDAESQPARDEYCGNSGATCEGRVYEIRGTCSKEQAEATLDERHRALLALGFRTFVCGRHRLDVR